MFHTVCCELHHEEHQAEQHMPKHIHTVHHHHIQKQTIIKKIKVPVIKEVKVPFYVYEPFKVPYHYIVEPYIVKVPIEYHNEEKHEEVHHPSHESHSEHDGHLHHKEQFESMEEESDEGEHEEHKE